MKNEEILEVERATRRKKKIYISEKRKKYIVYTFLEFAFVARLSPLAGRGFIFSHFLFTDYDKFRMRKITLRERQHGSYCVTYC